MDNVIFLLDVDNTLLDNDRITADLREYLEQQIGHGPAESYWRCLTKLREELGYVDYLGALQWCRIEYPHETNLLLVSRFLIDYPFADRLFPQAFAVIHHLQQRGAVVILSDGDIVFQPHKIERAGLFQAVQGRVFVSIHKEKEMENIRRRYPACRHVLFDDKLDILSAVKKANPDVKTVFVRQGHYAEEKKNEPLGQTADLAIDKIGHILTQDISKLLR